MQRYHWFVLLFGSLWYFVYRCHSHEIGTHASLGHVNDENGCQCAKYACSCCIHLEVPKIGLNDTGCVNVTYLAKEYGVAFTVSLDGKVIYNETVSVTNPPPYCIGVPYLKQYAELCIRFYQLRFSYDKAHGCIKLEARLSHAFVAEYDLGCFDIGSLVFHNRRLISRLRAVQ